MQKDNVLFLLGGVVLGVLFALVAGHALERDPLAAVRDSAGRELAGPAGPRAPTQVGNAAAPPPSGGGAAAPMVAEINALKQSIQDDPTDVAAMVRLANLYHQVNMFDQAIPFYEMALERRPDDPDLLSDLGICYRSVQRAGDALAMFDRAQAANPDHWQSLFNIVVVAGFDLEDFDRADAAIRRLDAIDPPPPQLDELKRRLEEVRAGARG